MKKFLEVAVLILLFTLIVYIPILLNNDVLLSRNNDLQEFFWAIILYIKKWFYQSKSIPFWNNLFLSGTPLLPDPQSPIFYPPNIIFLILPIEKAFIVSFLLHTFFAGVFTYLCTKIAFNFNHPASLFSALLYITTPKLASLLEAGHVGLIYSLTWLPLTSLSLVQIIKDSNVKWSVLLAAGLVGIYYGHPAIFIFSVVLSTIIFLFCLILDRESYKKRIVHFTLGALLTFGLMAVTFLPQIEWQSQTTRKLLIQDKDVYPKWFSKMEFVENIFVPLLRKDVTSIDSEKWIAIGLFPSFFTIYGFFKLKKSYKYLLVSLSFILLLLVLNNASPVYQILINQGWYSLLRVSTRIWPIVVLTNAILAGISFNHLSKRKRSFNLISIAAFVAIVESVFLFWMYLKKPIVSNTDLAPREVYEYLAEDKSVHRVFCLNRCLSQKTAAEYGLELADGYSTLQQINYYNFFTQIAQSYWDRYSLSLPPFEIYMFQKLQPWEPILSVSNIKYVISKHKLTSPILTYETTIDNYRIYSNPKVLNRVYFIDSKGEIINAEIIHYRPGHITIKVDKPIYESVVLSTPFNRGWKVYLDNKKVDISKWNSIFIETKLAKNIKVVDFIYKPTSYVIGKTITITTILLTIFFLLKRRKG